MNIIIFFFSLMLAASSALSTLYAAAVVVEPYDAAYEAADPYEADLYDVEELAAKTEICLRLMQSPDSRLWPLGIIKAQHISGLCEKEKKFRF